MNGLPTNEPTGFVEKHIHQTWNKQIHSSQFLMKGEIRLRHDGGDRQTLFGRVSHPHARLHPGGFWCLFCGNMEELRKSTQNPKNEFHASIVQFQNLFVKCLWPDQYFFETKRLSTQPRRIGFSTVSKSLVYCSILKRSNCFLKVYKRRQGDPHPSSCHLPLPVYLWSLQVGIADWEHKVWKLGPTTTRMAWTSVHFIMLLTWISCEFIVSRKFYKHSEPTLVLEFQRTRTSTEQFCESTIKVYELE